MCVCASSCVIKTAVCLTFTICSNLLHSLSWTHMHMHTCTHTHTHTHTHIHTHAHTQITIRIPTVFSVLLMALLSVDYVPAMQEGVCLCVCVFACVCCICVLHVCVAFMCACIHVTPHAQVMNLFLHTQHTHILSHNEFSFRWTFGCLRAGLGVPVSAIQMQCSQMAMPK